MRSSCILLFISYHYSSAHTRSKCLCIYLREYYCLLGEELNSLALQFKTDSPCKKNTSGLVALQACYFLIFHKQKLWIYIKVKENYYVNVCQVFSSPKRKRISCYLDYWGLTLFSEAGQKPKKNPQKHNWEVTPQQDVLQQNWHKYGSKLPLIGWKSRPTPLVWVDLRKYH